MGRNKSEYITKREFEKLEQRLYKMSGFYRTLNRLENSVAKLQEEVKVLIAEKMMVRRVLKKLEKKTVNLPKTWYPKSKYYGDDKNDEI